MATTSHFCCGFRGANLKQVKPSRFFVLIAAEIHRVCHRIFPPLKLDVDYFAKKKVDRLAYILIQPGGGRGR